jgi:hypothetical protein
MAIEAHLVELERKHRNLESELHDALMHLSTDDMQIVELKRRKLHLKDQIERLKRHAALIGLSRSSARISKAVISDRFAVRSAGRFAFVANLRPRSRRRPRRWQATT